LEALKADLERARQSLADAARDHGSWFKAAIFGVFTAACFTAEFVLTWQALAFLFDLEGKTFLAVMLGLAPPCALAVFEVLILRMIEEPWKRLRHSTEAPPWRRRAAQVCMILFLAVLAAGNVQTVLFLAEAREEAARVKEIIISHPETPVVIDRQIVTRAVLSVSIWVTVDGAFLLLLAFSEARAANRAFLARRACARVTALKAKAEEELARRVAALVCCREAWASADSEADLASAHYTAQLRVLLARTNSSFSSGKAPGELIKLLLPARLSAPSRRTA
jgi:hypothetical protein